MSASNQILNKRLYNDKYSIIKVRIVRTDRYGKGRLSDGNWVPLTRNRWRVYPTRSGVNRPVDQSDEEEEVDSGSLGKQTVLRGMMIKVIGETVGMVGGEGCKI